MIVLEEKISSQSFIRINNPTQFEDFEKDLSDFHISESLTLMFTIFYLFRDQLEILFDRKYLDCKEICRLDNPDLAYDDIVLFETFKEVILYLHVRNIKLQFEQNQKLDSYEPQLDLSQKIAENILFTCISFSLSIKFLNSQSPSKSQSKVGSPLSSLSIYSYILEHYPRLLCIFESSDNSAHSSSGKIFDRIQTTCSINLTIL